jgi:membrane protease YdiL (CAAX protease family)
VQSVLASDLLVAGADSSSREARIDPSAEIASSPDGPFSAPAVALRDAALRENFTEALELPAIASFRLVRGFAWAGLVPLLMLAELDREMGAFEGPGAMVRALVGGIVAVWIARDLLRPIPRHPRAIAAVELGAAARLVAINARHCAKGSGLIALIAPVLAVLAAIALLAFAPSPRAIVQGVLARLGLPEGRPSLRQAPLVVPVIVASMLPVVLFAAMHFELPLLVQAAIFVGYASLAPLALRLPAKAWIAPRAALTAAAGAFVLTLGLAGTGHFTVQSAAAIARCLHPETWPTSIWRTLASTESLTLAHPHSTAERWLLVLMTIAFVPWAEERIYRGVLQRALTMRFGSRAGIALAATIFGLAHLGVYRSALWQAILLGVGFGVAFEEGGMLCAVVVHAVWNLYLLV